MVWDIFRHDPRAKRPLHRVLYFLIVLLPHLLSLIPPVLKNFTGNCTISTSLITFSLQMTSTCVHNPHITFSPEKLFPTFTSSPSLPADMHDSATSLEKLSDLPEESDPDVSGDFEFLLDEPVNMLPADQLFSDGKIFPFIHPEPTSTSISSAVTESSDVSGSVSVSVRSTNSPEFNPVINGNGVSVVDSFMYSPKAPKCSSKWKELLGLRKLYQNSNNSKQCNNVTTSSPSPLSPSSSTGNGSTAIRSIKQFLYRTSKSSTDSSINLPLLNDVTNDNDSPEPPEPASLQSRHSLSSSSSGHDPDDVHRLSLDSEKQLKVNLNLNTNANTNTNPNNPVRMKLVKTRTLSTDGSILGVSIESPRMNSSGKIVFHSLERSSSSPSSFNGGNRLKHRGMERSYSGNVRITPVLNVPVCSLRGFPLFSSSQKHEAGSSNNNNKGASRNQQMLNNNNNKSKSDRS